jgi:hypothetical protein
MRAKPTTTYTAASARTWEMIRAAYLSGLSAPALAARFGVSEGAIRKRAGRDALDRSVGACAYDKSGRRPSPARLGILSSRGSLPRMDDLAALTTPAHRVHLDGEGWAVVRADYESGVTPRMLAERHGLGERTIRRRAALERWARRPLEQLGLSDAHGAVGALDFFVRQRRLETDDLLLAPSPEGLLAYAFRRATEAAALGRPTEATGWMRLVDQTRRNLGIMQALAEEPDEGLQRRAMLSDALYAFNQACDVADEDEAPPPFEDDQGRQGRMAAESAGPASGLESSPNPCASSSPKIDFPARPAHLHVTGGR